MEVYQVRKFQENEADLSNMNENQNPVKSVPIKETGNKYLFIGIFLLLLLSAGGLIVGLTCGLTNYCKPKDSSSTHSVVVSPYIVSGKIFVSSNTTITGATIYGFNNAVTTSASDGSFQIAGSVSNTIVSVLVVCDGYANSTAAARFENSTYMYFVTAYLTKIQHVIVFEPSAGLVHNVTTRGNYNVTIKIPSFSSSNSVKLHLSVVDPSTAPGFLESSSPGAISNSSLLQSFGMFYVNLVDVSTGKNLVFPNSGIQFSMNLNRSALQFNQGADEIGWYYFNTSNAKWDLIHYFTAGNRRLTSFLNDGTLNAAAQAEGYWNYDRNPKTVCSSGILLTTYSNYICQGGVVNANGPDGIVSTDTSNSLGQFTVCGAYNWGSTIQYGGNSMYVNMVGQSFGNLFVDKSYCQISTTQYPTYAPNTFFPTVYHSPTAFPTIKPTKAIFIPNGQYTCDLCNEFLLPSGWVPLESININSAIGVIDEFIDTSIIVLKTQSTFNHIFSSEVNNLISWAGLQSSNTIIKFLVEKSADYVIKTLCPICTLIIGSASIIDGLPSKDPSSILPGTTTFIDFGQELINATSTQLIMSISFNLTIPMRPFLNSSKLNLNNSNDIVYLFNKMFNNVTLVNTAFQNSSRLVLDTFRSSINQSYNLFDGIANGSIPVYSSGTSKYYHVISYNIPTAVPSRLPTISPTKFPSTKPSSIPSRVPTASSTKLPTHILTSKPSVYPSAKLSVYPSVYPTVEPSCSSTNFPTIIPTDEPTFAPSSIPSTKPSMNSSVIPSNITMVPSILSSISPSKSSTHKPTSIPSFIPSSKQSNYPSVYPTSYPSVSPTSILDSNITIFIKTIVNNIPITYSGDGSLAIDAKLNLPTGVAIDVHSNIYITDSFNNVIRFVNHATNIITTIAGIGVSGYSGDGGLASNAKLNGPTGITVDSNSNIYFTDIYNNAIRYINAITNIITTIAGIGVSDYSGDGGSAIYATLNYPYGVAIDSNGNIYIADSHNNRIRYINAITNNISTIAGSGEYGYLGDGGLAIYANLNYPYGVAVDNNGNIYFADTFNNVIRFVNKTSNIITTIAGSNQYGYSGDGGLAINADLSYPFGISTDNNGNIYIADTFNNVIRFVNMTSHIITTVAGSNQYGYSGDGGSATSADLSHPNTIAVDNQSNIYIVDTNNSVIRYVNKVTNDIGSYAGFQYYNLNTGSSGDGGLAINAKLNGPTGTAVDSNGNIYIADTYNNVIRYINAITNIITTIAGNGTGGYSGDGGLAINATLNYPTGIAIDNKDNIYIADSYNNRIRFINAITNIISTIAGQDSQGYSGDEGLAVYATLSYPTGIAVDNNQNVYFADTYNNRVRFVNKTNNIISTIAGSGQYGYSGDGGLAINAGLNLPNGVAVDNHGNIYFSDTYNNAVRFVNMTSHIITTIAGSNQYGYSGDGGSAINAKLSYPSGLTVDSNGNVYISDGANRVVRFVNKKTNNITTIAGTYSQFATKFDASTEGINTNIVSLGNPSGLALNKNGDIYIADSRLSVIWFVY